MPSLPTVSDLHVDSALTDVMISHSQSAESYFAAKMLPIALVDHKSDRYHVWDRADVFRDDARRMGPSSEAKGAGVRLSNEPYSCDRWGVKYDIAEEEEGNADDVFNLEQTATRRVFDKLMIRLDRLFSTTKLTSGVWGQDLAGVAAAPGAGQFLQWNDAASTPIEDITGEVLAMKEKTGRKPNKLGLGPFTFDALRNHPDIVDRYKYTQPGVITPDLLAPLFDVDEVIIMDSIHTTSGEGAATTATEFIAGKTALLLYTPGGASITDPSAGYHFMWRNFTGSNSSGMRTKAFDLPRNGIRRIQGEMAVDCKITSNVLGTYFGTAVA